MTQYLESDRTEVARIARAIIDTEIRPLMGARLLCPHIHRLKLEVNHDLWALIVRVDGETDGLPIGSERERWAPDVLLEKDRLADIYEQKVADQLMSAARQLVEQYSSAKNR